MERRHGRLELLQIQRPVAVRVAVLDEGAEHGGAYAQVHVLERGADLVLVQRPAVVGVVAREGGGNLVLFWGNEPREEEPDERG